MLLFWHIVLIQCKDNGKAHLKLIYTDQNGKLLSSKALLIGKQREKLIYTDQNEITNAVTVSSKKAAWIPIDNKIYSLINVMVLISDT